MHNMLLIARREYREQIRSRAFRMSTVGLPAVFALVLGIAYMANQGIGANKHIVIAAADIRLGNAVRQQLVGEKKNQSAIDVTESTLPGERDQLLQQVQTRAIDGVLWIDQQGDAMPTAIYYSNSSGDFMTSARLKNALDRGIVDTDLVRSGVAATRADSAVKGVDIATFQVKKDGAVVKSNAQASFWKGYVMAILLSMTTILYGMNVARSIIQEKTSRIFEVMLSIVKPSDMLTGKLLGVGAVGLTQIAIWLVAATVLIASPLAAALMTGQYAIHVSVTEAVLFPVYFVLGFLLYSSLFAGLAATCETEQELQMFMPLAALPTWLSFALIVVIINDSNSIWSIGASLFPPTAPVVMFLRMASEIPPAWQFALSIALMMAATWAVLWFSSRLYRVGILMYGKRATLPEILRWVRMS